MNKLPIIPFLEQYVSDNGSLNYNKKNIFGNISKDILQAFFSANLDVNPYNYTYLNIIKATSENSSTNDKRSSYTYEKFLEFLNSFKELIEGNKLNKLQEDLLELITNANFILTNSQLSPMNNLINYILKKDYLNYEKSSKNCIKFYYNCSLIPMPEYRILLSNAFHFSFINEQTIASFKKECLGQIELNEQNSSVNYASDTTVNAFNGYVEYLATKVIPNMIIEFFKNIQQSYRPLDNKGNINDNLMKLNKDIDNSWQSIFQTIQDVKIKEQSIPISKSKNVQLIKLDDKPSINSINTFYSIPKDKSINLKNIYCINPDDKPFIIKDGKLIVNYATKVNEKINKKEVINFNNINKDSFVNLHKLIFSAIYYDDEKLIISNDEIKHVAAKIEIDRLQDKEKLEKNVNKWYHQNRDSIIKKFNSLKGTEK